MCRLHCNPEVCQFDGMSGLAPSPSATLQGGGGMVGDPQSPGPPTIALNLQQVEVEREEGKNDWAAEVEESKEKEKSVKENSVKECKERRGFSIAAARKWRRRERRLRAYYAAREEEGEEESKGEGGKRRGKRE